MTPRGNDFL